MQRITLSGVILGVLLVCCGSVLRGSEADELRERAMALRKKASFNAEQGNKELAERLERESGELLEAAERLGFKGKGFGEKRKRPGIDKEVHQLKGRLQDLRAKEQKLKKAKAPDHELGELQEQIAGTERELKQIHDDLAGHGELPPEFRDQAEKLEIAGRRINHLRVAAQNLKMAEMPELANKLMEQAEGMERDLQEAKQHLADELHKRQDHDGERWPNVVVELKEEIRRLRAEVKELSQKIDKQR